MKTKTLSDKMKMMKMGKYAVKQPVYKEEDVKEFIRMLKYEVAHTDIIDGLSGDRLKEGPFV